ncbi:23S rRNA (pseudouridine(1915)-N(3))-methyltransferase RlmH [Hyphococcus sp.]|uniref:23S rRNA (pseudouridine(1915)-N(3))-methyltransferase RlmH n=1 Tax=Hyphococcus sp. TaxID=2038636 RepID=UPI003CCC3DC8
MKLLIGAIGKMRGASESALFKDYCDRTAVMGRGIGVSGVHLKEREAPKSLSGPTLTQREGSLLLAAAPDNAEIIALDERGENISSKKLAAYLDALRKNRIDAAFLIGGAGGHDEAVRQRAGKIISFGAATWPHILVRVMLAEQLYRAVTILTGHPYHRA